MQEGLNRWRAEEQKERIFNVDSATVIAMGDLLYQASGKVFPASDFTWDTDLSTTRIAFVKQFACDSDARSLDGETFPIKGNLNGIHEFKCSGETFNIGDLVGPKKHETEDYLLNDTVEKVTNPNEAIGKVTKVYTEAPTSVFVDLFSPLAIAPVAASGTLVMNTFQYPLPGTDFTPSADGAFLDESLTSKKVYLPISGLKVGDSIKSYKPAGRVVSGGNAVTLDGKLVKVDKDGTNTDVAGGGMTQVSETANATFEESVVLTSPEVIAAGYQYYLEFDGTTAAATEIYINSVEVTL